MKIRISDLAYAFIGYLDKRKELRRPMTERELRSVSVREMKYRVCNDPVFKKRVDDMPPTKYVTSNVSHILEIPDYFWPRYWREADLS